MICVSCQLNVQYLLLSLRFCFVCLGIRRLVWDVIMWRVRSVVCKCKQEGKRHYILLNIHVPTTLLTINSSLPFIVLTRNQPRWLKFSTCRTSSPCAPSSAVCSRQHCPDNALFVILITSREHCRHVQVRPRASIHPCFPLHRQALGRPGR